MWVDLSTKIPALEVPVLITCLLTNLFFLNMVYRCRRKAHGASRMMAATQLSNAWAPPSIEQASPTNGCRSRYGVRYVVT
jgi:hypothetical protein